MRPFAVVVALGLALAAAPSFAQSPQPATPSSAAAAGARFAFINIQRVASESVEGKASTAKVQALNQQKVTQLNDMNKKLQADQQKLQSQSSVLNDATRGQLERDIDKQQKEIQRFTQDAQEEVQQLQTDLQGGFQQKLFPVIQKVVEERGIEILFSQADAGIVWANPALDITADVIKRFDAAAATAPATSAAPAATPAAPAQTTPAAPPKPAPAKPPVR